MSNSICGEIPIKDIIEKTIMEEYEEVIASEREYFETIYKYIMAKLTYSA